MPNVYLSQEPTNANVLGTDFIYTEKLGFPPVTYKTTVMQLQDFMGQTFVEGPVSATDNAIAAFNGTTGQIIKNSGATVDINGNISMFNLNVNQNAQFYGTTTLAFDPSQPLEAATKQYVDSAAIGGGTTFPLLSSYRTLDVIVPMSTSTLIITDVRDIDNTNSYSTITGKFTAPIAAFYRVSLMAHFSYGAFATALNFEVSCFILKNAVTLVTVNHFTIVEQFVAPSSVLNDVPVMIDGTVHLNAGETIEVGINWIALFGTTPVITYKGGSIFNCLQVTPLVEAGQLLT